MKKNMVIVLIISILLVLQVGTLKASRVSVDELRELTDTQKLSLLEKKGLVLTEFYRENLEYTIKLVSKLIRYIENGVITENRIPYNYDKLVDLTRQLCKIIDIQESFKERLGYSSYRLENSTPIGDWRNSFRNYNCFAYALDQREWLKVGAYSNQPWNPLMSVKHTADIVIDDLRKMGYTSYRTYELGNKIYGNSRLIALRIGADDYHFMKDVYNERIWEHKPASFQPMEWNYSSPEYAIWSNERVDDEGSYPPTTYYDSDVIYIYYWPEDEGPRPDMLKKLLDNKKR